MNTCWSRLSVIFCIATLAISLHGQTDQKRPAAPSPAGARNPFDAFRSFSATLNGGIGQDHDRKIYRLGNLLRANFSDSYRITDLRKQTMWGVQGDGCAEFAMPDAGAFPFSAYHDFKVERSMTAQKETVDGHVCAIENVTFSPPDGVSMVIKMKLWEADDLDGFPIRIEAEANGRKLNIAYTEVSMKPPDPRLFKHPAKCAGSPRVGQKGTRRLDSTKAAPKALQESPSP